MTFMRLEDVPDSKFFYVNHSLGQGKFIKGNINGNYELYCTKDSKKVWKVVFAGLRLD